MTSTTATLETGPPWGTALLVVLAAHVTMLVVLLRAPTPPLVAVPPAAIMIDLPAAPPAPPLHAAAQEINLPIPDMPQPVVIDVPQIDLPIPEMPAPAMIEVAEVDLPVPDMPAAVVIEVAQVEVSLAERLSPPVIDLPDPADAEPPKAAPALPRTKPNPPPEPRRTRVVAEPAPATPAPAPSAPPAVQTPTAEPTEFARAAPQSTAAIPSWQGAVLAHLERHKRYPSSARSDRQEGTATVQFTVDRAGTVSRITLVRSSGFATLDEEIVALLGRASPLPPPPTEAGVGPFELVAPVQFRLH